MEVFLRNFNFIWFNSFLALIAVIFGWLMLRPFNKYLRAFFGFMWFIFLPNTIYILTDVSHLVEDWPKVGSLFKIILIIQYGFFSLVGIAMFVMSIYFFQRLLEGKSRNKKKIKVSTAIAICALNFLVGFGVILGGIERTNSWHLFTDPMKVVEDVLDVLSSSEMLLLSVGVGILANLLYFLTVESLIVWGKKFLKMW